MSQCLGKIHCKTLEFELEIDFDSLWQGYCTSDPFFFNTYSQGAPQIVKTQVVVKLKHTLRHSTCVSMSFVIIEPHKMLGGDAPHRLHVRLRGHPTPGPLPSPRPPPRAPMPRPVCPRGATVPLPLPLGPLPAPTPLSPCPCRGSRPLSPAPWPALPAPVPVPCPCPCPWLHPRSPTAPRSAPCAPWPPAWAPCRAPARPSRALAPSWLPTQRRAVRCPRSVPLCCFWPRRLARVCALAPCRVCPGPPPARAPGHTTCRLLSPAPRSRGWHSAPPARRTPLPESRAGRLAASAAAAA